MAIGILGAAATAGAAEPTNPPDYTIPQQGNEVDECAAVSALTGVTYDGISKVNKNPVDETVALDEFGNEVTFSNTTGKSFDWESNFGIGAVLVKGGNSINTWVYIPPADSDTDLYSPDNSAGQQADISHVTFCWVYELDASKTADETYTRTWNWTIDKSADTSELLLSTGQSFLVNYDVAVDKVGFTDSDWAVNGDIEVQNNTPYGYTIDSVTDVVSPAVAATVECPDGTIGAVLASGDSVTCTYSTPLSDASSRTNTATVAYTKDATGATQATTTATAPVVFGDPTTVVNGSVNVTDTLGGDLGEVSGDTTFEYTHTVGPYATCGDYTVDNTAAITETGQEDTWTVNVTVPCAGGCTLTQGYWKTHSQHGPAPYDDAWLSLGPSGADTVFFPTKNTRTWYQVLWTSPSGNANYVLAHQYIAAKLNVLNGASSTPAVDAALTYAETYFTGRALSQAPGGALKNTVLANATTLDQYNNGLIGPGHCSE